MRLAADDCDVAEQAAGDPLRLDGAVSRHDIAAIWVAFFSRWQRYRCRQVQTKPVNYAGHFTASDPMVVSRTIMALEQHNIWAQIPGNNRADRRRCGGRRRVKQ